MYAANAGRRLATSCVLLGGSLEYAKSGGRSAVPRCAPDEKNEKNEPPNEEEDEEEGLERYLGYSAALARLKLVMLRAKTALGHAARTGAAKGAAAGGRGAATAARGARAAKGAAGAFARGAAARGSAAARAAKGVASAGARTAAAKGAAAKAAVGDAARYVAYSSDVGESMWPVLRPWMVNATYGIAVGYVLHDAGSDVKRKMDAGHPTEVLLATGTYKLVFHGLVSLAMPAVIIHSAVHQAHDLFAREAFSKMPRVVKWGPSAVGLGLIPLMPLLDPPAEHVLEAVFDRIWPAWRIGEKPHHD
jgi:hypothetical protein